MEMKNLTALSILILLSSGGCASMKKFFAVSDSQESASGPIFNPFGEQYSAAGGGDRGQGQNMILRTKKGDRSIEVELPRVDQGMTDFVIPVNPAFKDGRAPASDGY